MDKTCAACGAIFRTDRSQAKYCSLACYMAHHRAGTTRVCPACGERSDGGFCPRCGASLTARLEVQSTWRSTAAGTISIIEGILMILLVSIEAGAALSLKGLDRSALSSWIAAGVLAFLGILAISGGILALQRRMWGWALAGAVAAILPLFPLGIASIAFLVASREEFWRPRGVTCGAVRATWRGTAAGVINLLAGLLMLLPVPALVYYSVASRPEGYGAEAVLWLFVVAMTVLGALAVFGGVSALQRKRWGWALAGAVATLVPFLPLGIASIEFVVTSGDEFR